VGRLSYVRVLRGTLSVDHGSVFNVRTQKAEKIGGLLKIMGKETSNVPMAVAGDIIAIPKVESLSFNDSVCAENAAVVFPPLTHPKPMVSMAVTPKTRGDEQKIGGALEKLRAEDPTFIVKRNEETGELTASGMSTLHLEVLLGKAQRRYHVGIDTHTPRIPYRETINGKAEGHHRHKKQSGGKGQFGEVYLRVFPKERGAGFEFVDSIVGGSIPRQFIPEVEKGIRGMLGKGIVSGCQVVDVGVEIYDGKYHDVDSDQISFQLAGSRAFVEAFEKAKPILLEPIMNLVIEAPTRFTGDITGNLNSRRGRLSGMETTGDIQVINAHVPLKEAQDYSTQLRSITAGEGVFSMEFSHYESVPPNLQGDIVAQFKKAQEH
jgi:elongation factor G